MIFYFLVKENPGKISGHVPGRMICCAEQGSQKKGILLVAHRINLGAAPRLGTQLLQTEQLRDVSKRACRESSQIRDTSYTFPQVYLLALDGGQED